MSVSGYGSQMWIAILSNGPPSCYRCIGVFGRHCDLLPPRRHKLHIFSTSREHNMLLWFCYGFYSCCKTSSSLLLGVNSCFYFSVPSSFSRIYFNKLLGNRTPLCLDKFQYRKQCCSKQVSIRIASSRSTVVIQGLPIVPWELRSFSVVVL